MSVRYLSIQEHIATVQRHWFDKNTTPFQKMVYAAWQRVSPYYNQNVYFQYGAPLCDNLANAILVRFPFISEIQRQLIALGNEVKQQNYSAYRDWQADA